MKTLFAVSVFAIGAAAGQAYAADPIMPAPIVPGPVVDSSSVWDGFYAGLNAGYGWGEGTFHSAITGEVEGDIEGWLGGAQVGYNFANGGIVFGIEGDIQAANIVYEETLAGIGDGEAGIQSFGSVRARIGADLDTFMPYLTAGVAFGQVGYDIDTVAGPSISDEEWGWGWAAGAGVEAMVFEKASSTLSTSTSSSTTLSSTSSGLISVLMLMPTLLASA
ncbi:outer membrane beta-barrel protein [Pelagibacterium sp. H642]|uniref:outer membrane protein n=1 Tax=Pelagibacterium sp. H642 TaxID=1881069 RepID=UPI002815184B|nr:outer membrane beta-barrel protein [Pelagibacterium sp. H642]WMT92803.1 porin family protein [Pelagibacterium sp. H642]